MVRTRNDTTPDNSDNSEISDGAKLYLEGVISGLRNEIADLRTAIEEKNERILSLEKDVVEAVQRNLVLAAKIDRLETDMVIALDDHEQYSRKDSLRIEGIEYVGGESNSSLKSKVINRLFSKA